MSCIIDINTTIKAGTIDFVFKEVTHSETLGLRNPAQLCFFYLKLDRDTFSNESIHKCLRKNIRQYFYSRTRIAKFKEDVDYKEGSEHSNIIISEVLSVIDKIILFKL